MGEDTSHGSLYGKTSGDYRDIFSIKITILLNKLIKWWSSEFSHKPSLKEVHIIYQIRFSFIGEFLVLKISHIKTNYWG